MFFHPLGGWRHIKVTSRRTKRDFAECMKDVVDTHFPHAEVICVVLDNLNTHTLAALQEAFGAKEVQRIGRRLELHDTPEHGSWLNMVEIELSAPQRQCLARRIGSRQTLEQETAAWETARNACAQCLPCRRKLALHN